MSKILPMLGFVIVGGGVLNFGLPVLFKELYKGEISQWGLIMSSFQAGSFLGTLLLPVNLKKNGRFVLNSVVIAFLSVGLFLLPFFSNIFQLAFLTGILGVGFTYHQLYFEVLIQKSSSRDQVGMVMAILAFFGGTCSFFSLLLGAMIVGVLDVKSLFIIGAIIIASTFLVAKK